jgi:hypothetical protein
VSDPVVSGSGGTLKIESDGGEKVLNQGSYWEIIEQDGTQYYFGRNQLPGYVSGDPTTTGTRSPTSTTPRPATTPRATARPGPAPTPRAVSWRRSSTACAPARSTAPPQPPARRPGRSPSPDSNTASCYPSYWYSAPQTPTRDWFNIYSVSTVTNQDTTGADPAVVTSFSYAGAAWRYDNDTVSRSVTLTC